MISYYTEILGGRIHYVSYTPERSSAREKFVFLHGNSSSAQAFEGVAKQLPANIEIVGIDLPGHGLSDGHAQFKRYFSFQGCREIFLRVLESIRFTPTGIIGHSMGGHIAAQAAPELPSLSRLILISAPPIGGREALGGFFRPDAPTKSIFTESLSPGELRELAVDFTTPGATQDIRDAIETDIAQTDGLFRSELGTSLASANIVDELAILKGLKGVDFLFVGGAADRFIDPDYYVRILAELRLDEAHRNLLPGVGHYPHREAPAKVSSVLQNWMASEMAA